jgi:Predicted integral membrane protein
MTPSSEIPFRRGAVEPVECLKAGWNLVSDQYWLFVGMCAVAMIVGSAVPLGILMGPMMCGMYLAFFRKRRGLPIEFGTLFKGFDYFGQSVVAALLHVIPIMVVVIGCYILVYVGMFATMIAASQVGEDAAPVAMLSFVFVMLLFYAIVLLLVILISVGFTFAYPLIVDRGVPGFDAVKLSFRAAFANFWRLLGMSLLGGLLAIGGMLLCYIGILLVFPITLSAVAVAYEQVFGLSQPGDLAPNLPPPPPTF